MQQEEQERLLAEYYQSFPKDPKCENCEQRPYIVKGDAGTPGNAGFEGGRGASVSKFSVLNFTEKSFPKHR